MAPPKIHEFCTFGDCGLPHFAKGLCKPHYHKSKRGTLDVPIAEYTDDWSTCEADGCDVRFAQRRRGGAKLYCSRQCRERMGQKARRALRTVPCSVDGCDRIAVAKSYCNMHLVRFNKTGDPGPAGKLIGGGEWRLNVDGYLRRSFNGRTELQHRVVMEQMIGRPLLATENVHHVNGDRADNRPENLELWTTSQPAGQRVADKVSWAREILALYGEDY